MMSPQQVQQILFPSQLQALLHQQQQALLLQQQHLKEFYKKQQEQMHLHLRQQHPGKKAKELSPQQLVFQQLFQLQQQQQILRVQRPVLTSPLSPAGFSPAELLQIWKELTNGLSEDKSTKMDNLDSSTSLHASTNISQAKTSGRQVNGQRSHTSRKAECAAKADCTTTHTLYSHGVCNWPGCESVFETFIQFIKHLGSEHTLDDRSTAQCRVQMQVVQQLDLQLSKERERLQAMMAHLHLPPSEAQSLPASLSSVSEGVTSGPPLNPTDLTQLSPPTLAPVSPPPQGFGGVLPSRKPCAGAMRRHHHPSLSSLSSENESSFQLYKNADIRPPFTYATLIRQAIMEASDLQLTLNEIYSWFTHTFAYFRRNAATWKNAVRHNLSLHKCFVRVENMKGAVWTVDEVEYQRRRAQKITGSPMLMKNMSSSLALETALNANLQSALAEAALPRVKSGSKELVSSSSVCRIQENRPLDVDTNSHSNPNSSPQLRQSLFVKEETLDDDESLMLMVKASGRGAELQRDVSGDEELFDLE